MTALLSLKTLKAVEPTVILRQSTLQPFCFGVHEHLMTWCHSIQASVVIYICPKSIFQTQSSLQPAKTHSPGVVPYEGQWGGLGPTPVLTLVVIRLIAPTCGSFANINQRLHTLGTLGLSYTDGIQRVLIILRREAIWCWTGAKSLPYNDKNPQCIVMLLRRSDEIWEKAVILLRKCHFIYDIWRTCLNIYSFIYNICILKFLCKYPLSLYIFMILTDFKFALVLVMIWCHTDEQSQTKPGISNRSQ